MRLFGRTSGRRDVLRKLLLSVALMQNFLIRYFTEVAPRKELVCGKGELGKERKERGGGHQNLSEIQTGI